MQTLQTLVRNLAVILLLATFLEMLLPNKSMRGYVQLVMGLFVISAILSPLTTLFHLPLDMEIPAWKTMISEDVPVLATENTGEKMGKDAVQEQYRQILVHQIEALALGVNGVKRVEVELQFIENSSGLMGQPRIAQVMITLLEIAGTVKPIEPVIIGQAITQKVNPQSPRAKEVQARVAALMELPLDIIYVQEK